MAIEDWIGAGAIVSYLSGRCSPEAQAARDAFQSASTRCESVLAESVSGRELIQRGYPDDVKLAAELNSSSCAPVLKNGAFVDWSGL